MTTADDATVIKWLDDQVTKSSTVPTIEDMRQALGGSTQRLSTLRNCWEIERIRFAIFSHSALSDIHRLTTERYEKAFRLSVLNPDPTPDMFTKEA